jgi:hypothetical protein
MGKKRRTSRTLKGKPGAAVKNIPASAGLNSLMNNFLLFIIAIFLLLIIISIHSDFFNGRIVAYWDAFQEQKAELDIEARKTERLGNSYAVSKQIADFIKSKRSSDVVLMPSTAYFNANGIDYHVPEPAVFYYYTSVKTIWQNCKAECNANWFVHVENGRLFIDTIQNKAMQDSILKIFNKYEAAL